MEFDIGISPLPFGDSVIYAKDFEQRIARLLQSVISTIVIGLMIAHFFSLLASSAGPVWFVVALVSSLSLEGFALISNWNSVDGLISYWIGLIVVLVLSLVKTNLWDLLLRFLEWILKLKTLAEFGFGRLYTLISFAANILYLGKAEQRMKELGVW